MSDSFLAQQISQRASNVGRLQDLISSNKNMFSSEWKETAQKDFQEGLDKYSTQLQNAVGKEIANKSEAIGILAGTPAFYSVGTGTYKNLLSKEGKESLDNIARKMGDEIGNKLEPAKQYLGGALDEAKEELGNISQRANQMLGRASERIGNWTGVSDNQLLQRQTTIAREQIMGDPENPLMTDPTMSAEEAIGNVTLPTATSNSQTTAAEEASRSNLTENISSDTAADIAGTEEAGLSTAAETGATSGLADEITAGLLAAAPEAGPGAIILGGLAGLVGIGAGLASLFAHHTHKPKQYIQANLSTPAIASRYDITKTILPSSTQSLGTGGTMQF